MLPRPEVLHHTYPGQSAPFRKVAGGKSSRCTGRALRNIDEQRTSQPCSGLEATSGNR